MSMIDDVRRDRESGTPGPWTPRWPVNPEHPFISADCNHEQKPSGGDYYMSVSGICDAQDARRIARVPELEAALLAADELAALVDRDWSKCVLADFEDMRRALAAYRAATEAST